MGLFSWIAKKAKKFYLNYSMVTSIYMMEPTEVVIINSVVVLITATMAYSTFVYLPMYIWRLVTNPFSEQLEIEY
jgi:TM2 domain-containing membrane protein YozV